MPQKPLIPAFEAKMRKFWIILLEFRILNNFLGRGGKPSARLFVVHVDKREGGLDHECILMKYIFEGLIDCFEGEESASILILHEIHEHHIDREASEGVGAIGWRSVKSCIDKVKYFFSISVCQIG